MDPNANLTELRRLVVKLLTDADYIGREEDGKRLAELCAALDGWLTGGGFLPAVWGDREPTADAKRAALVRDAAEAEETISLMKLEAHATWQALRAERAALPTPGEIAARAASRVAVSPGCLGVPKCHGSYNGEHVLSCPLHKPAPAVPGPTRAAFLVAYRFKLSFMSWARNDPGLLDKFMCTVEDTLTGRSNLWLWDSPLVREAFTEIGGTGRLTLKALRALPA